MPSTFRATARYHSSPRRRQRQALAAGALASLEIALQHAEDSRDRERPRTSGARLARVGEDRREGALALVDQPVGDPERRQAGGQPQAGLHVAARAGPGERGAQVLALASDPVEPGGPLGPAPVRASLLGHGQIPARVRGSDRRLLAARGQPLARELADRLEHAEAPLGLGQDEVLLGERLQPVARAQLEIATAHGVGGGDAAIRRRTRRAARTGAAPPASSRS